MSSPREAIELLETLRSLTSSTRLDRGNHECSAWTDREFTVHYSEGWATETDVRRRLGPRVAALMAAVTQDDRITRQAARKAARRDRRTRAGRDALVVLAGDKTSKARLTHNPADVGCRIRRIDPARHSWTMAL